MHAFQVKLDMLIVGKPHEVVNFVQEIKDLIENQDNFDLKAELEAKGVPVPKSLLEVKQ